MSDNQNRCTSCGGEIVGKKYGADKVQEYPTAFVKAVVIQKGLGNLTHGGKMGLIVRAEYAGRDRWTWLWRTDTIPLPRMEVLAG